MRNNKTWSRFDDFIYWINGHNWVYSKWRDICCYCNAIYRYHKVVTSQVDWDYEGIFGLLLVKIEGCANSYEYGDGRGAFGSKKSAYEAKANPNFFDLLYHC